MLKARNSLPCHEFMGRLNYELFLMGWRAEEMGGGGKKQ